VPGTQWVNSQGEGEKVKEEAWCARYTVSKQSGRGRESESERGGVVCPVHSEQTVRERQRK